MVTETDKLFREVTEQQYRAPSKGRSGEFPTHIGGAIYEGQSTLTRHVLPKVKYGNNEHKSNNTRMMRIKQVEWIALDKYREKHKLRSLSVAVKHLLIFAEENRKKEET